MNPDPDPHPDQVHIVLLSIHGLIRGHDLELGRDPDTGGQILYVLELARALGRHPRVKRVDLMTRRVVDPQISDDYAVPIEPLGPGAQIVRIDCCEPGYIPKEKLWDGLDNFVDDALEFLREDDARPHLIHSHYADAGYVGQALAGQLGIPLVHTGHSLGRVKRRRLLAGGLSREKLELQYNISQRIAAEESTLGFADLVITSTRQEIESQYEIYNYYRPEQMKVIPPGTDLQRFHSPSGGEKDSEIFHQISRFLNDPDKPMILALSRPDPRKNIPALITAFGKCPKLQEMANLVLVAGNRADLRDMDGASRDVITEMLLTLDRHDLYGKVAYPKFHRPDDVPLLYRLAAMSGGVFINPALTEPFGLTLLEAAASGLPIVATDDGGPTDIIANCGNGLLVNPLDPKDMAQALQVILADSRGWKEKAANGLEGVRHFYSWEAHTESYLDAIMPLVSREQPEVRVAGEAWSGRFRDRALVTDLDKTLLGEVKALEKFIKLMADNRKKATYVIATGRRLDSALRKMRQYHIPRPDVLITSLGTDIYYAPHLTQDTHWRQHIDHLWNPRKVRRLLRDLPGLKMQPKIEQGEFKISYYYDPTVAPSAGEIESLLHKAEITVQMIISFGQFLDIIPARASKGAALRWFAAQREVPLERILTAGGSGADEDLMRGNTLAVVVANRHHEELSELADIERIYFAEAPHAGGILEAIEYYDFFGKCQVPES